MFYVPPAFLYTRIRIYIKKKKNRYQRNVLRLCPADTRTVSPSMNAFVPSVGTTARRATTPESYRKSSRRRDDNVVASPHVLPNGTWWSLTSVALLVRGKHAVVRGNAPRPRVTVRGVGGDFSAMLARGLSTRHCTGGAFSEGARDGPTRLFDPYSVHYVHMYLCTRKPNGYESNIVNDVYFTWSYGYDDGVS